MTTPVKMGFFQVLWDPAGVGRNYNFVGILGLFSTISPRNLGLTHVNEKSRLFPSRNRYFGQISARFLSQGFPAFGLRLFVLYVATPSTKLSILMGKSSYEFLFALFARQLYLFRQGTGFSST